MNIDFATFLAWEATFNDAFIVRRAYVRMTGDLNAGILLSRIIYYYLPDKEGNSRLRVMHDDEMWIAKGRDEWQQEICLSAKQIDRAALILEKQNLIEKAVYKFDGTPKMHVRLRVADFLETWGNHLIAGQDVEVLPTFSNAIEPDLRVINNIYNYLNLSTQINTKQGKSIDRNEDIKLCPSCNSPKVVSDAYDPKGRCAYCLLLAAWKYYFENKPQPKITTKSYRKSAEARWKSEHFRDNYREALANASKSPTCNQESWFHFEFFVRNDENYQLMLDKWMEWKDEKVRRAQPSKPDAGLGQM